MLFRSMGNYIFTSKPSNSWKPSFQNCRSMSIPLPCLGSYPLRRGPTVLGVPPRSPHTYTHTHTHTHAHTHTHIHTPASLSSLAVTSVVCGRSFGARGEMAGRRESYGIKICYSFLSRIFTELNTHIHTSRYTGASCCVRVL